MNINKKILSWSLIISLLTAYILPGRIIAINRFKYGYPFRFFEIPKIAPNPGGAILPSTNFNIFFLALNVILIYSAIKLISLLIHKKLVKTSKDG